MRPGWDDRFEVLTAFLLLVGVFVSAAGADAFIWKGGGEPDGSAWDARVNWVGQVAPAAGAAQEVVIPGGCDQYPRITQETVLTGILRIKDGGRITVSGSRLIVNQGLFVEQGGAVEITDGGEIWSDAPRARNLTGWVWRDEPADIGLKLRTSFKTSEVLPDVRRRGGVLPEVWRFDIGPDLPADIELVNIAPYAERSVRPYTTMTRHYVDIDPQFRTFMFSEPGVPPAARRLQFRFDAPQPVAQVQWNSPVSRWALMGDTNGDGEYDLLLAMDLAGVAKQPPAGFWQNRTTASVNIWPATKLWGVCLVDLQDVKDKHGSPIYDFQILSPADQVSFATPHPHAVMRGEHLDANIPLAQTGDELTITPAPPERQLPRGFHIEPWMFGLDEWIDKPAADRPPLSEYDRFADFIKQLRLYNANTVNLWPPKKFNDSRGPGVYEMPLLWPSQYDRHSLEENILAQVAAAFRKAGIRFMSMTRTSYPKPVEEMPDIELPYQQLPLHQRRTVLYLPGIVREQAASGVDGVGIGFDEQEWSALDYPAAHRWGPVGQLFKERYGIEMPAGLEDSLAFRKWVVFGYEQFAEYLANASSVAKQTNSHVLTKSPVHITLATLNNDRTGSGVAEDIVSRIADIDYSRAYAYLTFESLGHYVTALATKVSTGGRLGRKTVSLHNCPWTDNPQADPGFFLHFPRIYMLGSPLSAVMHSGNMPLIWRYNWIFRDGYEEQVRQSYGMLGTLSAWGITDARTPKHIAVLRSRASEDWWQVRQRYRPDGDLMDQTRGYIYFKALAEILLTHGYPFDVLYLDHPQELDQRLTEYDLLLLPFAYSVSREAAAVLEKMAASGKSIVVFERRGETDEWGEPYEQPALDVVLANPNARWVETDVTVVGQHRAFQNRLASLFDQMLGQNKPVYLNSYGNDIEVALLEKNEREKFLATINWTDRPVTFDVGVKMPAGSYRVHQAGPEGAHAITLDGRTSVDATTLAKFRMNLNPWDARVLYLHPE